MGRTELRISLALLVAAGLALAGAEAHAQGFPAALKGRIITSNQSVEAPATQGPKFIKELNKQDRKAFPKDEEGKWVIHFLAFFNKALPGQAMGVVVLDEKKEPVASAEVGGQKGQTTLSSHIVIDSTEFPGKEHTLQVYYPKGGKPIVLATKKIVLK